MTERETADLEYDHTGRDQQITAQHTHPNLPSQAHLRPREQVDGPTINPGPEHILIIAKQQQEHRGTGQQYAGEHLHTLCNQAQRRAGDQHDHRAANEMSAP
jgi:hypothetical protein